MAVYFIENPRQGIKIGFSDNVASRVRQLQTGSAYKLKILAVIPHGTRELEAEFHRLFARWRREGEWFTPSGPVVRAVSLIRQGAAPLLRDHLQQLMEYAEAPRETRIKMRPPAIVPEALRGTLKELQIRDMDAATRRADLDQVTLGRCHQALRWLLRGREVDITFLAEYDRIHLTPSREASTAS